MQPVAEQTAVLLLAELAITPLPTGVTAAATVKRRRLKPATQVLLPSMLASEKERALLWQPGSPESPPHSVCGLVHPGQPSYVSKTFEG